MRVFPSLVPIILAAAAPCAAQPPSELAIGPEGHQLRGTLLMPARRSRHGEPVLILAGSGPTDRDGNNPLGITAAPYRLLAEALAARGIPVLRVDKRGIAGSSAAIQSEEELRIGTYADDALGWVARLRADTHARCVWLLGHSEGTLHALVASRHPDGICGLILVSPVGRRLGDVIREQLTAPQLAPIRERAMQILAELEAGRPVADVGTDRLLLALFRPSVQPFVMSMLAIDPAELARRFRGPILVVEGTTDLQTTVADAERLAAARPGVTLRLIEGMNHVWKTAPADRAGNAATYGNSSLPLAPGLVDAIAGFIEAN
jgi:pimeloyl-ACP methyl ester carboxylesterase